MTTFHNLVTLSDASATELTPAGEVHSGLDLTVQNVNETAVVYIGASGVTASNYGFKLEPGDAFSVELNPRDQLFAISDTDGASLALLRVLLEDL